MKKKYLTVIALIMIIISAIVLSGFCFQRNSEYDDIALLLQKRTSIMQEYLFRANDTKKLYARLSEVETTPLLTDDYTGIKAGINSDLDKVINMKIISLDYISKRNDVKLYDLKIKWYMLGQEGYYITESKYILRTIEKNNLEMLSNITANED